MKRDYYEVLGVEPDARPTRSSRRPTASSRSSTTPTAIPDDRRRRGALQGAREAYQVLCDAERRAPVRSLRPRRLRAGRRRRRLRLRRRLRGHLRRHLRRLLRHRTRRGGRARARRGEDLRYELEITFEEAAFGCEKTISIPRLARCDDLQRQRRQAGHARRRPARSAAAPGRSASSRASSRIAKTCGHCNGQGTVIATRAPTCGGAGARAAHAHAQRAGSPPASTPARA